MTRQPLGVLILHGFTSSLDCVNGLYQPLAVLGLPLRMPVLRGHGADSPAALEDVRWQDWVEDGRNALCDLLTEVERAVIFGHSMGTLVALMLAADAATDGPELDSLILAAPAVQLTSPLSPGRPLSFLAPLMERLVKRWDMPPNYADPALAAHDTNYAWAPTQAIGQLLAFIRVTRTRLHEIAVPTLVLQSRNDSTVAARSAEIVCDAIATPAAEKRIVWFEKTEHEMLRDCEAGAVIEVAVDYVRCRYALAAAKLPVLEAD